MTMKPPASAGMPLGEVDTPALLIDLDAFERNLKRMAAAASGLGMRLRPHSKTHKSPVIALKQMALGAVGVCCQKVAEAEALVEGGVSDVLVSNEIIGRTKLDRLAALARHATIRVCADDARNVPEIAAAAARFGVTLDVLVEIDVGGGRCGVVPGAPAVVLARQIAAEPRLRFAGLQAYQGAAQHLRTPEERREAIARAGEWARGTVHALRAAGLSCDIVGGGGTGTFELEGAAKIWNELQTGSYIFMDADYARNLDAHGERFAAFEHALFVYVTVMSHPAPERAVVDAGHKALGNDSGFPDVWGYPEISYNRPSDEHGVLDLSRSERRPTLGDKLLLVPGHCDPTVNLHDWYVGLRGLHGPQPYVEAVWPVAARGATA